MKRSAIISDCGLYRYELRRVWDETLPPFYLGMLNPSTADHEQDDPTIRRGIGFAKRENCGSLIVWNIGAGRATSPKVWLAMEDPIGPENYNRVRRLLEECLEKHGKLVVAWGGNVPQNTALAYELLASEVGVTMYCFGTTKSGDPRHPLYLSRDVELVPYRYIFTQSASVSF